MVPDWHKIQFPQYLLIHPMAAVPSVDTVVVRTRVIKYCGGELNKVKHYNLS